MCMDILSACMCGWHPTYTRRGGYPQELELQIVAKSPCGWWEPNLDSLQDQLVLLTAGPSLAP